jgi:hypothetical protein
MVMSLSRVGTDRSRVLNCTVRNISSFDIEFNGEPKRTPESNYTNALPVGANHVADRNQHEQFSKECSQEISTSIHVCCESVFSQGSNCAGGHDEKRVRIPPDDGDKAVDVERPIYFGGC